MPELSASARSPSPPAGLPASPGPVPPPVQDTLPTDLLRRLIESISREVIGYEQVVRALAVALVAEGHVLLEGVPGLAKTYLVRAFSRALQLDFRRIQFTPDMLPSDILGTTLLRTQDLSFEFRKGPIFANVILADEINRAPPKVQSALLEAMQERQVTIEGRTYPLPRPFMVIATQNPIEQEGTYPLPEAELDRFLFRWILDYPSAEDEVNILKTRGDLTGGLIGTAILQPTDIERLRALHGGVFVGDDLFRYLASVVRETRTDRRLLMGASPRASVQFLMAVKAAALLDGRSYVIPDDVRELAFPVINHRVIVRPEVLTQSSGVGQVPGAVGQLRLILREDLDRIDVPR
jgi:MoxR-like ATPase